MRSDGFPDLFLKVSGTAYLILATDACLALACAPVWALVLGTAWSRSWLALALVSPLLWVGIAAAYRVFEAFVRDGEAGVFTGFWRAWVRAWRPAGPLGAGAAALFVVIGVDVWALRGTAYGRLSLPVFVVIAVLAVLGLLTGLAALTCEPGLARLRALALGGFAAVRHPGWSLASLAALAVFAAMVVARPALALLVAPAPVLYVVWYGAVRALTPYVGEESSPAGLGPDDASGTVGVLGGDRAHG